MYVADFNDEASTSFVCVYIYIYITVLTSFQFVGYHIFIVHMAIFFCSSLSESWAVIQKYMQRQGVSGEEGSPPLPKPAFYATLVLLLKAAYRYVSLMSPQQYAGINPYDINHR